MVNAMRALAIGGAALMSSAVLAGETEGAAKPDPRLGKEVNSICFASTINGWRSVKGEDNVVLLQKGVKTWYRVELIGSCREYDLRSALTIGIDSRPGGGCVTRGDVILVRGPGNFVSRCPINKMYEWSIKPPTEEEPDEPDEDETE